MGKRGRPPLHDPTLGLKPEENAELADLERQRALLHDQVADLSNRINRLRSRGLQRQLKKKQAAEAEELRRLKKQLIDGRKLAF